MHAHAVYHRITTILLLLQLLVDGVAIIARASHRAKPQPGVYDSVMTDDEKAWSNWTTLCNPPCSCDRPSLSSDEPQLFWPQNRQQETSKSCSQNSASAHGAVLTIWGLLGVWGPVVVPERKAAAGRVGDVTRRGRHLRRFKQVGW